MTAGSQQFRAADVTRGHEIGGLEAPNFVGYRLTRMTGSFREPFDGPVRVRIAEHQGQQLTLMA